MVLPNGICVNELKFMSQVGFDSVHFARIDYQDRAKRKADKSLEVIWQGSKTFGSSSQVPNCKFTLLVLSLKRNAVFTC